MDSRGGQFISSFFLVEFYKLLNKTNETKLNKNEADKKKHNQAQFIWVYEWEGTDVKMIQIAFNYQRKTAVYFNFCWNVPTVNLGNIGNAIIGTQNKNYWYIVNTSIIKFNRPILLCADIHVSRS